MTFGQDSLDRFISKDFSSIGGKHTRAAQAPTSKPP